MKHPQGNRRGRRPNGRRGPQNIRSQNFESNGPEGRIRGTAQQVLEKYLVLGRDAASAGEHIKAEAFYQHAEHYFRLLNSDPNYQNRHGDQRRPTPADGDTASFSNEDDSPSGADEQPAGMGDQPPGGPQPGGQQAQQTPPPPAAGGDGGGENAAGREIPISQGNGGDKNKSADEAPKRRGRPPKAAAEAPAE